jgi:hypothetical protein
MLEFSIKTELRGAKDTLNFSGDARHLPIKQNGQN